jgi:hypothetical protein
MIRPLNQSNQRATSASINLIFQVLNVPPTLNVPPWGRIDVSSQSCQSFTIASIPLFNKFNKKASLAAMLALADKGTLASISKPWRHYTQQRFDVHSPPGSHINSNFFVQWQLRHHDSATFGKNRLVSPPSDRRFSEGLQHPPAEQVGEPYYRSAVCLNSCHHIPRWRTHVVTQPAFFKACLRICNFIWSGIIATFNSSSYSTNNKIQFWINTQGAGTIPDYNYQRWWLPLHNQQSAGRSVNLTLWLNNIVAVPFKGFILTMQMWSNVTIQATLQWLSTI